MLRLLSVKFVKIKATNTFTSYITRKICKIIHSFDCNNKYLTYLFNCKTCGKQYTDKTTDHFRSSWNSYKCEARKAESGNMESVKQQFSQSHYFQIDLKGFIKGVEIR